MIIGDKIEDNTAMKMDGVLYFFLQFLPSLFTLQRLKRLMRKFLPSKEFLFRRFSANLSDALNLFKDGSLLGGKMSSREQ